MNFAGDQFGAKERAEMDTDAITSIEDDIAATRINIKKDVIALLRGVAGREGGASCHMISNDYTSIVAPPLIGDSSATLWDRVLRLGHTSNYIAPTAEASLIDNYQTYFSNLFVGRPVNVVEMGPGSESAVYNKTLPSVIKFIPPDFLPSSRYIAIDKNGAWARGASAALKRIAPKIQGHHIHGDFTEHHDLKISGDSMILMWGLTASQFPLRRTKNQNEVTFPDLLENFGNMIDHKGLFLFTIDTNQNKGVAESHYGGRHFRDFKLQYWRTAQHLIETDPAGRDNIIIDGGNESDLANALVYLPRYEDSQIIHSFMTTKKITFNLYNEQNIRETFETSPGAIFDTGTSQKWAVKEVANAVRRSNGWTLVNDLPDNSGIHAIVLAGKNTSQDLLARAKNGTASRARVESIILQSRDSTLAQARVRTQATASRRANPEARRATA